MGRTALVVSGLAAGLLLPPGLTLAETLRVALVSQRVVNQYGGAGPGGIVHADALVDKPIRVLSDVEAAPLGGRGEFRLVAIRPPSSPASWTEIEIEPRTTDPDDRVIVEIGGELSSGVQVLAVVLIRDAAGSSVELGVDPLALIPGDGVLAVVAPFGRPLSRRDAPSLFYGHADIELLVVRSLVEAMVDGGSTINGLADVTPSGTAEWREGDRVLVRVPVATLRAGPPELVLGWKDRVPLAPLLDQ